VRSDVSTHDALRSALQAQQYDQAQVQAYIRELRALAMEPLDTALANLGTRIDPNLYFRKAKLLFDQSAYSEAKIWFQKALVESDRVTYSERKQEMLVRTHHALAVLAWREADWDATVRAFETVVQLQQAAQRTWVDDAAGWLVKAKARRAEASKR
jgi:tetratricopeptide (TPR) repeat protein